MKHLAKESPWRRTGWAGSRSGSNGGIWVGLILLLGCACEPRQEPVGAELSRGPVAAHVSVNAAGVADSGAADSGTPRPVAEGRAVGLGSREDALPFAPSGDQVASIAWRTWVYTDVGPRRTRYGYLRAGAVVDIRGPAIRNVGCAGGWYRINPRGFVCVGRGATLALDEPVVRQSAVRPQRGSGLPYHYAMSTGSPPFLYFRLPSDEEVRRVEGMGPAGRGAIFRRRTQNTWIERALFPLPPPPAFLADGGSVSKPYGMRGGLRYSTHAGRASADSGFALARAFEWQGRAYGLTTELDIIALDRVDMVRASEFHGIRLEDTEGLPVAFVDERAATKNEPTEQGGLRAVGVYRERDGIKLSGEERRGGLLETREGFWVPRSPLRILPKRESFPSVATGSRKWIDISIRHQTLVAYEGERAVYATLISSGRGGMGDPETAQATVRGTFMIHSKHVTATMDGEEDRSESFDLRDVPFVQYFHRGYALHGAYWHDEFGKVRSHGCINLSPLDAAWLFEWTDPVVPQAWHSVLNKERGTVVFIHG